MCSVECEKQLEDILADCLNFVRVRNGLSKLNSVGRIRYKESVVNSSSEEYVPVMDNIVYERVDETVTEMRRLLTLKLMEPTMSDKEDTNPSNTDNVTEIKVEKTLKSKSTNSAEILSREAIAADFKEKNEMIVRAIEEYNKTERSRIFKARLQGYVTGVLVMSLISIAIAAFQQAKANEEIVVEQV